jgi:hypothetical protein
MSKALPRLEIDRPVDARRRVFRPTSRSGVSVRGRR